MSGIFIAKAKDGAFDLGSEYNRIRLKEYLKENDGKVFRIQKASNPVSEEMRGYMFGAVIPFLRQIDTGAWRELSDEQVYEVLKKNFNYFEAYNPLTKRTERYGQSVMNKSCSNVKASEFIMRLADWVLENYGQTLPDSEEYKNGRDMAPIHKDK